MEVETKVAKTGVLALLKGDHHGKVVALRADMDALPVTERNQLPFKTKVTTEFLGSQTGVMHACGHDTHTAILMGTAQVLVQHKDKIPKMREKILTRIKEMVPKLAEAYGGKATIEIQNNTAVTFNDVALTKQMLPSLPKVAKEDHVELFKATTGGKIFRIFRKKFPDYIFSWAGNLWIVKNRHHIILPIFLLMKVVYCLV